ncbi:MAG TPA: nucleoside kinase [Candidatus Ozemobacteraceae bacterium]|nr:nucleoside kinase [Candidatus Ozemobacteraceae bacterium]
MEPQMEQKDENITITLKDGTTLSVKKGTPLLEVAKTVSTPTHLPILCARVDNDIRSLDYSPTMDCRVEFIDYRTGAGQECYRRSITFVLARAVLELYRNARLVIGHSIGNAFYYDLYTDVPVSETILGYINERMRAIIGKNEIFEKRTLSRTEAVSMFKKEGYPEKARLVQNINNDDIGVVSCWKYIDLDHGPMVPSTGYLNTFELKQYSNGFVLLFPDPKNPVVASGIADQPKIFQVYRESKEWGKILEANNVGRLNHMIQTGQVSDFVKVAEALHEKKIGMIADEITRRKTARIVLIAGPSSSGKTTFSKRLCIQLRVNGLRPIALSLDNYFLNRDQTPRDEDGNFDFEDIHALDLELIHEHLAAVLQGREIQIPKFEFATGSRKKETTPLRINDDQILIIEGIHGLNDELTTTVPASAKFKIYISALTQLVIDDYNRISTTDTRLIRRTVRDKKYRSYAAEDTIQRWPSVRRGEERNIFPFQEKADMVFNSAIPYELSVLKTIAEPLFGDISPESPSYSEARRILRLLSLFKPLDPKEVPPTSILREFVGGSSFHY